jgi:hypothetical protein
VDIVPLYHVQNVTVIDGRRFAMKTTQRLTVWGLFAAFATVAPGRANKATLQFSGMTPYLG